MVLAANSEQVCHALLIIFIAVFDNILPDLVRRIKICSKSGLAQDLFL
jgi:hypothetical protein